MRRRNWARRTSCADVWPAKSGTSRPTCFLKSIQRKRFLSTFTLSYPKTCFAIVLGKNTTKHTRAHAQIMSTTLVMHAIQDEHIQKPFVFPTTILQNFSPRTLAEIIKQLHDLNVFKPRNKEELTKDQLGKCLRFVTLIKDKRCGNIKEELVMMVNRRGLTFQRKKHKLQQLVLIALC